MINEKKVKLMTKITIFEKNEELGYLKMSRFFKEDYVQFECLKTLISVTLVYWLAIALYVLLNIDKVMSDLYTMDYFEVIQLLMSRYIILMIIFYIYAFIVYHIKYALAKPKLVKYNRALRELLQEYEDEENKDFVKVGKVRDYSDVGTEAFAQGDKN